MDSILYMLFLEANGDGTGWATEGRNPFRQPTPLFFKKGFEMNKLTFILTLSLLFPIAGKADVLPSREADAICRAEAVRAVRFMGGHLRQLAVTFKSADVAEISTAIVYEFYHRESKNLHYTVVAYAYPDDRSCFLGSVTNNIAGND